MKAANLYMYSVGVYVTVAKHINKTAKICTIGGIASRYLFLFIRAQFWGSCYGKISWGFQGNPKDQEYIQQIKWLPLAGQSCELVVLEISSLSYFLKRLEILNYKLSSPSCICQSFSLKIPEWMQSSKRCLKLIQYLINSSDFT